MEAILLWLEGFIGYLPNILLLPIMAALVAGTLYALWCVVSLVAELFMQRRRFAEDVPGFIDRIESTLVASLESLIEGSGLLVSQKDALLQVARRLSMDPVDLCALANREVQLCRERHEAVLARTRTVAVAAPLVGLMGTLILLAPGMAAAGFGQGEVLSASVMAGFDSAVAGLLIAVVCLVVTKVRQSWYAKYHHALDACMTALLEKAETFRALVEEHPEAASVRIVDESKRKGNHWRKEVDIPLGPSDADTSGLDVFNGVSIATYGFGPDSGSAADTGRLAARPPEEAAAEARAAEARAAVRADPDITVAMEVVSGKHVGGGGAYEFIAINEQSGARIFSAENTAGKRAKAPSEPTNRKAYRDLADESRRASTDAAIEEAMAAVELEQQAQADALAREAIERAEREAREQAAREAETDQERAARILAEAAAKHDDDEDEGAGERSGAGFGLGDLLAALKG